MNKGGEFLKRLLLRRGESITGNLVLKCKLAILKSLKADVSSVSPSSERLEGPT